MTIPVSEYRKIRRRRAGQWELAQPDLPDITSLTPDQLRTLRGKISNALIQNRSGGRNGGRPPKPTPCPKCGLECASVEASRQHCQTARKQKRGTDDTAGQDR